MSTSLLFRLRIDLSENGGRTWEPFTVGEPLMQVDFDRHYKDYELAEVLRPVYDAIREMVQDSSLKITQMPLAK